MTTRPCGLQRAGNYYYTTTTTTTTTTTINSFATSAVLAQVCALLSVILVCNVFDIHIIYICACGCLSVMHVEPFDLELSNLTSQAHSQLRAMQLLQSGT